MSSQSIAIPGRRTTAKKRKLVLVIGSLQAGGAERVMSDMANHWVRQGWHITLATWSGADVIDFYRLEPTVNRVWLDTAGSSPKRLYAQLVRIWRLRSLIEAVEPDAVISFIETSNVLTILACRGLNIATIVSERNNPAFNRVSWRWRCLRRLLYQCADAVVVQTKDIADWVVRNCRTRARVIPNALRALPDVSSGRAPLVLAVGRLVHQKGFDVLLRAFGIIHARFPEWRMVVVGSGPDESALRDLCDKLLLTERVEFRGTVTEVEAWMARAGIVVQPSRFEGFPNVLLESMGMGAAVISTFCSGPADIIRNGINGRLVPIEDVDALAHAMATLMSEPHTRERYGQEARTVRLEYCQDRIMADWEKCIADVAGDSKVA